MANPQSMPQYPRTESPWSKRGQKYRGPSGEVIPNLGQQRVPVKTETGDKRALTFQSAPVRKPLMAVSGACDRDQFVFFDNDGSFIAKKDSEEGKQIRALIKKMRNQHKIALTRKGGTYIMPVQLQPFPRQGA